MDCNSHISANVKPLNLLDLLGIFEIWSDMYIYIYTYIYIYSPRNSHIPYQPTFINMIAVRYVRKFGKFPTSTGIFSPLPCATNTRSCWSCLSLIHSFKFIRKNNKKVHLSKILYPNFNKQSITCLHRFFLGGTFPSIPPHGCFLKWWYPQIIHFNRVFHITYITHPFWGTLIFWKPPFLSFSNGAFFQEFLPSGFRRYSGMWKGPPPGVGCIFWELEDHPW